MGDLKEVGQIIKQLREEKNMSQEELAFALGYKSRSSITKIENGDNDLPQSKVKEIAHILGTSPATIMGWKEDKADNKNEDIEIIIEKYPQLEPLPEMRKVPLLGAIACGEPIYKEEDEWISLPIDVKADFCLRCEGDSMINARIYNGDIVFIKACEEVENGEIAAVSINNEVTLKRVFYYKDKNKLVLHPENTSYEPFVYTNEELNDIRILGKAVMFLSKVK